jgi:uridylate kinase
MKEISINMSNTYKNAHVIKLGGSLLVPDGGIDAEYVNKFNAFIRKQIAEKGLRFFIFTGGGQLARHYIDAAMEVIGHELTNDDLDWLGVHATRLNAHLLRTIFRDLAHPVIIKDYSYILAQDYSIKTIIKMSNADYVYDRDPRQYPEAKPFDKISWKDYRAMVGDEWTPGSSAPFDPVAAKLASELEMKVLYLNGTDLANVERAIDGKQFVGTIIG